MTDAGLDGGWDRTKKGASIGHGCSDTNLLARRRRKLSGYKTMGVTWCPWVNPTKRHPPFSGIKGMLRTETLPGGGVIAKKAGAAWKSHRRNRGGGKEFWGSREKGTVRKAERKKTLWVVKRRKSF